MSKIFLVFGHYNQNSFNAAIRDTFKKTAEEKGLITRDAKRIKPTLLGQRFLNDLLAIFLE